MVNTITESGMDFVDENVFHIEKSRLYTNLNDGVRSVEFVRIKDDKLIFVEAKASFPNPDNPCEENLEKFKSAIEELCEKFIHSLHLLSSVKLGVQIESLPIEFSLPERTSLVFLLVIKNHKFVWLKPIKGKIESTLPSVLKKIWKPEVIVINQAVAIKHGLVVLN